jgi:branched-chain amino acid transport system permease protein
MLMIGGPGNNAGTFIGTALIIAMRRLIIIYKWNLASFIWYPIVLFESQLLGVLLLIVLIFRPNGLIPEKLLRIPGINYKRLVREETKVDWQVKRIQPVKKSGFFSRFGSRRTEEKV